MGPAWSEFFTVNTPSFVYGTGGVALVVGLFLRPTSHSRRHLSLWVAVSVGLDTARVLVKQFRRYFCHGRLFFMSMWYVWIWIGKHR